MSQDDYGEKLGVNRMALPSALVTLANHLAGEFDNREQAIAEPVWYVHLRLWQRPVPLFLDDSLTLFAEQANVLKLDQPYRQRILRIQASSPAPDATLQVQYYALREPDRWCGAGCDRQRLQTLTVEDTELLPGCRLEVTQTHLSPDQTEFHGILPPEARCCFCYQGQERQVILGFVAQSGQLLSFDKGSDTETGQALWGALMGPYCFTKRHDFSQELRF